MTDDLDERDQARRFLARHFDPDSDGPPDVETLSRGQVAFVLAIAERWDDFVEYVQAVWERVFNLARGDDERLTVGAIHAISLPDDDDGRWEISLTADRGDEDTGAVITHTIVDWEIVETGGVF